MVSPNKPRAMLALLLGSAPLVLGALPQPQPLSAWPEVEWNTPTTDHKVNKVPVGVVEEERHLVALRTRLHTPHARG
eukprot:scaffold53006_cov65-Phaeocystis_antarctica.AAC.1